MHISTWMERLDLREEIQEVYLHTFLFKLGVKQVGIFLPLYILDLGFSITNVLIFFSIYYTPFILLSAWNASITSRIGYKHASLLASIPILLFYMLLRQATTSFDIYTLAFLGGFGFNLYWLGMNPEVANSSHDGDREKETGFLFSIPSIASIMSPIIGGMILALSNFQTLFVVSSALIAASFLPFLLTKEHYDGMNVEIKEFMSETNIYDFKTFFLRGFNSMGRKMFWPLYLAIIIGGSLNIGGAGSFQALGSALTSLLIGRILTDTNREKIILTGFTIAAATFTLMAFITTPLQAFLISLINGLSFNAGIIPIYSQAINHADHGDKLEYFALREITLATGRITFIATAIILFTNLPQKTSFLTGFTLLATSVILTGHYAKKMQK